MSEYIERSDAIMEVTRAELPDKTENGIPIANGKRKVTDCVRRIKAIPAADVQPVKHGKWKQTGGKYSRHKTIDRRILTCSVCGNVLYMEGVNAGRGDANYCPNCGARMDGDCNS